MPAGEGQKQAAKTEGGGTAPGAEGTLPKLPPGVAKMIEKGHEGKVKVTSGKDKLVIEETDGTGKAVVTPGGGRVPEDFPKDVPIYKGATVVSAVRKHKGHSLVLRVNDAPETVKATCGKLLKAQGWTPRRGAPGMAMTVYQKGNRNCFVMVQPVQVGCHIHLTVVKK